MESKYLLNIDADTWQCGRFRSDEAMERGVKAADRLQHKCRKGDTLVSIVIKNPRYPH